MPTLKRVLPLHIHDTSWSLLLPLPLSVILHVDLCMSAVILDILSTLHPLFPTSFYVFFSISILKGCFPASHSTHNRIHTSKGFVNMEASLYQVKVHSLPFSLHKQKPTVPFVPFHQNLKFPFAFEGKGLQQSPGSAARCAEQGSVIEESQEEGLGSGMDSEWKEMGKWRDKCQDKGMVELLECLEKEAIMGEDEGREPTDYNRRAKIFSESARVFRALKEGLDLLKPRQS